MCTRLKPSWQLPFWVQPVMREQTMMTVRMGSCASSCSQRYTTTIPSLLVSSLQRASLQLPWAWLVPLPVRWYECSVADEHGCQTMVSPNTPWVLPSLQRASLPWMVSSVYCLGETHCVSQHVHLPRTFTKQPQTTHLGSGLLGSRFLGGGLLCLGWCLGLWRCWCDQHAVIINT